ncbi:MAG: hypothetical protein H6925_04845 [Holosporaceae bacterium]|nr:MAG: hypothetical protein H6925_04845 [Holosporaceae bacterium]
MKKQEIQEKSRVKRECCGCGVGLGRVGARKKTTLACGRLDGVVDFGGPGFGKTRTGAETVRAWVASGNAGRSPWWPTPKTKPAV